VTGDDAAKGSISAAPLYAAICRAGWLSPYHGITADPAGGYHHSSGTTGGTRITCASPSLPAGLWGALNGRHYNLLFLRRGLSDRQPCLRFRCTGSSTSIALGANAAPAITYGRSVTLAMWKISRTPRLSYGRAPTDASRSRAQTSMRGGISVPVSPLLIAILSRHYLAGTALRVNNFLLSLPQEPLKLEFAFALDYAPGSTSYSRHAWRLLRCRVNQTLMTLLVDTPAVRWMVGRIASDNARHSVISICGMATNGDAGSDESYRTCARCLYLVEHTDCALRCAAIFRPPARYRRASHARLSYTFLAPRRPPAAVSSLLTRKRPVPYWQRRDIVPDPQRRYSRTSRDG